MSRRIDLATAVVTLVLSATSAAAEEFSDAQIEFFEKRVRPVLVENCFECHSATAKKLKAGLRLDSRGGMLTGGDSGPAIVAGDSEHSLLVEAIRYQSFEMPPRGKLSADSVRALVRWIDDGAAWPTEAADQTPSANEPPFDWRRRMAKHWAWQPIAPRQPPQTQLDEWATNAIDRFIAARLVNAQLTPAAPADRRTLIRRVYFDLIGLPPSPAVIDEFVAADDERSSYAKIVDELLDSPHFGEKWGRHWLDLARYAESYGHEFDYDIAHAHEYRDYVIRALNEDVPYDLFLREHFAGDLLRSPRLHPIDDTNESVIATGIWFLGEATHAPTIAVEDEAKRIENQIDVMSKSCLALSISCAMCHDHKFDPISTEDYYALSGLMKSLRLHMANLLPVGQLQQTLDAIRQYDAQGQSQLDEAIRGSQLNADEVARYLLETKPKVDVPPGHPLALWQAMNPYREELSDDSDHEQNESASPAIDSEGNDEDAKSPEDATAIVARRLAKLKSLPERRARFLAGTRPLGSFDVAPASADESGDAPFVDEDNDAWFLSDAGFRRVPASAWIAEGDLLGLVGVHGLAAGRLVMGIPGTARSPTFTLGNGHVFIRLRAKHATIRLIAHNYQLEPFNALLYGGTRKTDDELGDGKQFGWVHLGNALRAGEQAYLECVAGEDGFLFIDEVRIDDGPGEEPADEPSEFAKQTRDPSSLNPDQLATLYGEYWESCRAAWGTVELTSSQAQFVDWLVKHNLIELPLTILAQRDAALAAWAQLPQPKVVRAVTEGTPIEGRVAIRGNAANLGKVVPRRLPLAISGEAQPPLAAQNGRLELVDRLLDETNPFPARVAVNRIWHHLFGRGLVESVDDFGAMGQPPSHPALLDWLATDFRQHGWSQKRMIRQVVLSSTYRMSSAAEDPAFAKRIDPNNRWLHRSSIRRLPAEAIRDQMLTISSSLDPTIGGPSVPVFITPFMNGRGQPKSGPQDGAGRRSIYLSIRRNFLPSELMAFDFPVPTTSMGRRTQSNVPAQSLAMMNDEFVRRQAAAWAQRLCEAHAQPVDRIQAMFESATGRLPSQQQIKACLEFLETQAKLYQAEEEDLRPWSDLGHVVLNLKEVIFLR